MYFSPKSSSSSICLLKDWARSHLYSLPGLTICNPSNKTMVFLDRLYTSNTLLYSKIGPARQVLTLQNHQISDLGKQRERSPCSLKIKISTSCPANLIPSKFPTQTLFQTQNPKDVHDAPRTTKVRDLGKQRKQSLCLWKTKFHQIIQIT